MVSESKRAKTHMTQVWINTARSKYARAIGLREGRVPTWPLGTHHVDRGVWNAWICACANHTRPTRGTRRELGSEINGNEEVVNIYRQTPHKPPHEVSRIRRVLHECLALRLSFAGKMRKLTNSQKTCLNSGVNEFDVN
jgi:hypothetical protein